ncbi:hypothetical protein PV326_000629, partial [Microctonus aethiopoides]
EAIDRHDAWVKFLKMGKKISPMQVCSRHLTRDDYIPSLCHKFYLKKTAVPSVNLPKSSVDRSYTSNNQTSEETSNFDNDDNFQGFVDLNNQIDTTNGENLRVNEVNNKLELPTKCNMEITSKQFNDVAIQMQIDHFIQKFSDFISNDSELSILTGIPNFHGLNVIMKLGDKKIPKMSHSNAKLDLIEIIIMNFMKLKQNISHALLAILFKSYTIETWDCNPRDSKDETP